LTKILIDSLNEKELAKGLTISKHDAKGIDKLESFLFSKKILQSNLIEFLRNLQTLRSTFVAHRKSERSKDYKKAANYFKIKEKRLKEVFEDILIKCIGAIIFLDKHFLIKEKIK
jgi:hypothetical protein